MLKKLEDYLPNIHFMTGISTDERWFISTMIILSRKTKNPFIDVPTFMEMSGWGDQKVKRMRKRLRDAGFFSVTKIGKNGRQYYELNIQKLEDSIVTRSVKITPLENDRSVKITPPSTSGGVKITPHNEISYLTRYNVRGGVVFKDIKLFENRVQQLTEKLTSMKANNLINGEATNRSIPDIVADLVFHIDNRPGNLTEVGAANGALNLLQKGAWSRPKGLREKIEAESIARERAAQLDKQQELADMRSPKNVAIPQIQRMLASLSA